MEHFPCVMRIGHVLPNNSYEIFSESGYSKPNFDCNNTFPIDLAPKRIPFGTKSIGKV